MRKVIVNSTPLIALCKAGELLLLKRMYEEITVKQRIEGVGACELKSA